MKFSDMDRSPLQFLATGCVTAAIIALVPSALGQVSSVGVTDIEPAPQSVFDAEREESHAKFLSAGPISIRPHLYMTAYYDDNLALSPHHEQEDLVWRVSPGVLFGMGEFRGDKGTYLSLDYTPTGSIYTKYSDYNSLDHYVAFNGGWKGAKLTLGVGQSYEIANGKQVEASAFVEQETYLTLLTSKYQLSDKTSFELNGRQALVSTEQQNIGPGPDQDLISVNEWTVEGWGNYKTTEKLVLGLGATFGWRDIRSHTETNSPNQAFQQVLARGLYQLSEKVDLNGAIGAQFSQFEDGDDEGPDFIFSLGASWQVLERTSLALDAYRQDRPSYTYNGQNYTATGFRASVRQLFLEKYSAMLAFGYENTDYSDVTNDPSSDGDRNDNYFWIRPTLDYQFNERWTMGVFYQYRHKTSNADVVGVADAFDYSNNQIGLYSNYRF